MIITGLGHYVALVAEGPGEPLWYSEEGNWVEDEGLRKVFTGVQVAVRTPILGLPHGYHARLTNIEIVVDPQVDTLPWDC